VALFRQVWLTAGLLACAARGVTHIANIVALALEQIPSIHYEVSSPGSARSRTQQTLSRPDLARLPSTVHLDQAGCTPRPKGTMAHLDNRTWSAALVAESDDTLQIRIDPSLPLFPYVLMHMSP
jgi:hypothetical protein